MSLFVVLCRYALIVLLQIKKIVSESNASKTAVAIPERDENTLNADGDAECEQKEWPRFDSLVCINFCV